MLKGSCICGAVHWEFDAEPEGATACNCTACRRYGALWIYGHHGDDVRVFGPTKAFIRGKALAFHFCEACGCITHWLGIRPEEGRIRMAVNVRLSDPAAVAGIPIDHFDGLDSFEDQPRSGRCVKDYWA